MQFSLDVLKNLSDMTADTNCQPNGGAKAKIYRSSRVEANCQPLEISL
jgi:hypothetical protein